MNAHDRRRAVLAGFFLSGITGLVYQGIWIRMLTLVVGGTTAALTTVLVAFMGGLALGSYLFGGLADRTRNPLRAYAAIEGLIAACAVLIPTLYQAVPPIYRTLDGIDPVHGPVFDLLRFALAVTFFGIPATLMGGTLPLIVKALSQQSRALQVTVAEVYAINTFGATFGAFLTGFVVIPTLGLYSTLYLTAAINLLLAGGFWFVVGAPGSGAREAGATTAQEAGATTAGLDGDGKAGTTVPGVAASAAGSTAAAAGSAAASGVDAIAGGPAVDPNVTTRSEGATTRRHGLLAVFFLMGASSLSYEVLWNRLLGLSFGSSVYAVSTMLTSFLLGIALGSWWLRARADRLPPGWATLGWIEVGIAVAAPLCGLALSWVPHVVQYYFMFPYIATKVAGPGAANAGFFMLQFALFVTATALMLVPTCLMGASFPLAVRLYADRDVGSSVGRVYASNTFGSIVGLLLTGFVLIRAFGTHVTSMGWSVVNGLLGLGLLGLSLRRGDAPGLRPRYVGIAAAALAVVLVGVPAGDLATLTSGVYYHAMELSSPTLQGEIQFHTEDDMGLVSIHEVPQWDMPRPTHTMKINGKFMATDGNRLPILHQFAHIPIFMRGDGAKEALVIGLGGGFTAEAVLLHPFERIEVVEISPGVIEGAHRMRPSIFSDRRLHVIGEDARSLLLTGTKKYDVIISETSDPWMTGVSNLYTRECFEYIRARLAPGGYFGTWLQTRHKRIDDVKIILRTMQSVFPHMAVFQPAEGDTLLVMSDGPLNLDFAAVKQRHARMIHEMRAINLPTPWRLFASLVMNEDALRRYLEPPAGGRPTVNTDDLPVIEFSTPRSINLGFKGREIWDDLVKNAPVDPDLPLTAAAPGEKELWAAARAVHLHAYDRAIDALDRAAAAGATDPYLRARALFGLGRYEAALEIARTLPPDPRQALMVAGCLLHLRRYAPLEAHLRDGAGWEGPAADDWELRILHRRKLLQRAMGGEG